MFCSCIELQSATQLLILVSMWRAHAHLNNKLQLSDRNVAWIGRYELTYSIFECCSVRVLPGRGARLPRRDGAHRRGQHAGGSGPSHRDGVRRLPLLQGQESPVWHHGVSASDCSCVADQNCLGLCHCCPSMKCQSQNSFNPTLDRVRHLREVVPSWFSALVLNSLLRYGIDCRWNKARLSKEY